MQYVLSTKKQLSEALKSVRQEAGLNQVEVGKLVGLLPKTISALENHPESTSIGSLLKLISALNLELILSPKKKHDYAQEKESEAYKGEW